MKNMAGLSEVNDLSQPAEPLNEGSFSDVADSRIIE